MIRPAQPSTDRQSAGTGRRNNPVRVVTLLLAAVATAAAGVLLVGGGTAGAAVTAAATTTAPSTTATPTPTPTIACGAPLPTITSAPTSGTGPDTEAPTVPGKPVLTVCGSTIYVRWARSTDNVGVARYVVYRIIGDIEFSSTTSSIGTSFDYTGGYQVFTVRAEDAAGNSSARSAATTVGTPPACPPPSSSCTATPTPPTSPPVSPTVTPTADTTAPTAPGTPTITFANGLLTVTWAPATDNVGVASYSLIQSAGDIVKLFDVTGTSWSTTAPTYIRYVAYSVVAVDAAGNRGPVSGQTVIGSCPPPLPYPCATTAPAGSDTQAPTPPGKPVVTVANGIATVTWTPATDNKGVVSYQLYHQWTDIIQLTSLSSLVTSYTFDIGTSGSQHTWWLTAKDELGNTSVSSGQTSIGTPPTCPAPAPCSPTATPTSTPTGTATPTGTGTCSVDYAINSQWTGSFQAQVRIRNTGTTPKSGWSLKFTFPGGQTITQIWNAAKTQVGAAVTVTPLSYNGTIAPGDSLTFGFIGTWSGSNAKPTSFTLNGATCAIG